MKVSSEPGGLKEKEAGVLRVKRVYLGSSNAMEKFIRKSFQTAPKPRCKRSYGVESPSIVSSIRMGDVFIMGLLMWVMENIFVSIMDAMSLLRDRLTLMVLKGFGGSPKLVCPGFAV